MARFAFVTLACAIIGTAGALEVVTPHDGNVYVAKSLYSIEWEGTGESRFEIDLYYCGSSCSEGDCGEWVATLCPYGDFGCPDSAGDYDVVMPEPMTDTSNTGYKVRVSDINDEESVDCSEPFTLLPSEETPIAGEADGRALVVTSPIDGDMAEACMEYTVEWDYDDGFGSAAGRFNIDLYEADGSGECGTFYGTVCDKEEIGCKDTQGDYDIVIPCNVNTGEYKIRIGVFDDDSTFDCSDTFIILGSSAISSEDEDLSMSFRFMF
ncbi:unnamed protein product [Ascophyllum nodosum]